MSIISTQPLHCLPDISATTAWHTDTSVQAGVQAVLRISKQTSPVCQGGVRQNEPFARESVSCQPRQAYLPMHIWVKNFRAELHCTHTRIKFDRLTLCRYDEAVARSPEGATNGYCSGTKISSPNAPLSNGEWGGPCQMDKTEGRYIGNAGNVCHLGFEREGEMGEDGHWHRGQAVANARPAFPYL
jgi:hypothetical protein